jgi:hypothetical protein
MEGKNKNNVMVMVMEVGMGMEIGGDKFETSGC